MDKSSHSPLPSNRERARLRALLESRGVPLTPNQASFWAWERLQPGHPALILNSEWNILQLQAHGEERLRQAFASLVARHACLKHSFPSHQGQPTWGAENSELDFETIELPEEQLLDAVQNQYTQPFHLETQPPFRVRLFRSPPANSRADRSDGRSARLLMQAHHIAADAWSVHILREELQELLAGRTLPPLDLDFPTYARWQAAWLEGPEAERLLQEWRTDLASPRLDTRLPTDFPRGQSFEAESVTLNISPELTQSLRRRAGQSGISLNALLLAALARFLSNQTGSQDITVAVPSAARDRPSMRKVVGPVFSLLPVRLCLAEDQDELLMHAARQLTRAIQRQELPFLALVEELRPRRLSGSFPFTSVALSVLPYGHPEWTRMQAGPVEAEHIQREFLIGPFDLTLNVLDLGQNLRATLQYNARLFEAQTAETWARQLQGELQGLVAPPSVRVEMESRVDRAFRVRAGERPEQVALISDDETQYTYAQIDRMSWQLARQLRELPADRPVGLLANPSLTSLVGWLAILKSGHICLPLDPALPGGRLRALLQDSQCQRVVTDPERAELLPPELDRIFPAYGGKDQPFEVPGQEAAYLLYTSGSEGSPRGVLGSHQGLLHRVEAFQRISPLGYDQRVLMRTPVGFVDSVTEWFSALYAGATLCAYPPQALLDPEALLAYLDQTRITRATLVPTLLGLLLRSPYPWPASLRVCIASGEVLRPDWVELFYQRAHPQAVLYNLYGSTECAGDVSWFDTRQLERGASQVPLGVPLGSSRLLLLDAVGQPVDEGEEGEIWVGGPGLALGYWNRPELTEKTFQNGLLRTGDRGALVGGLLEYRGRLDRQTKIRGWRLDPQEVESVLESCPGIQQAVVEPDGDRLRAWVSGIDLQAPTLWQRLRQELPPALVPSQIEQVSDFVRLPSGKVDRRQLFGQSGEILRPAPDPDRAVVGGNWRSMAALWEEVLGIRPVGAHDNFFQLGGHSLKAIELVERIEKDFQRKLPPAILLEAPTPAGLSAWLEQDNPVVVSLRNEGNLPTLWLIPGAYGGCLGLRGLASKLPAGQPVMGLEFESTDPQDQVRLVEVARRFAREVRKRNPLGPYRICGFSMGGLLAFEMARELANQVEHLILLDSYGPGLTPATGVNLRNRLHELWTHAQILARSRPAHLLERLVRRTRPRLSPSRQFELTLDYLKKPPSALPDFHGQVTLIRLSHQPDWVKDPRLGWSGIFPHLQLRTLVGLHGPLVLEEPMVDEAARLLGEVLGLS